jgi:SAM-dependent methyltransferase
MKSFCQSCENNKGPILDVLRPLLAGHHTVLEIGSGTGQHAAYFAAALPHLDWQTSDVVDNHPSIEAWIDGVGNARAPLALDVNAGDWPMETYDAVFSANTAHIMSWPSVEKMFHGVARVLSPGGVFALYGPFNYDGAYTSEGNERFDRQLRSSGGGMGIRDSEAIIELAASAGMTLLADHDMPANNRILVFARD